MERTPPCADWKKTSITQNEPSKLPSSGSELDPASSSPKMRLKIPYKTLDHILPPCPTFNDLGHKHGPVLWNFWKRKCQEWQGYSIDPLTPPVQLDLLRSIVRDTEKEEEEEKEASHCWTFCSNCQWAWSSLYQWSNMTNWLFKWMKYACS